MGGAVPPLPQYAFMAWCSVRGSAGDNNIANNLNPVFSGAFINKSRSYNLCLVFLTPVPNKRKHT